MDSDLILVIVVGTALAFDFTNGFHDTANVVATSISTRAMAPQLAVGYAAILNFVGAFLSLEVAATIASGIVEADLITPTIVFAGPDRGDRLEPDHLVLRPAVELVARADRRRGRRGVRGRRAPTPSIGDGLLGKVVVPALVAPMLAFVVAGRRRSCCAYRIVGRLRPGPVKRGFRSARSPPAGCSRSRTAPTTPRRRWASSRSR